MTEQDRQTVARFRAWIDATPLLLKIGTALLFAGSMFASGLIGHVRGSRLSAEVPARLIRVESRVDSLVTRIDRIERIVPVTDSIARQMDRNTFLLCILVNRTLPATSPEILACGERRR